MEPSRPPQKNQNIGMMIHASTTLVHQIPMDIFGTAFVTQVSQAQSMPFLDIHILRVSACL
jgi:hypothetical protein